MKSVANLLLMLLTVCMCASASKKLIMLSESKIETQDAQTQDNAGTGEIERSLKRKHDADFHCVKIATNLIFQS